MRYPLISEHCSYSILTQKENISQIEIPKSDANNNHYESSLRKDRFFSNCQEGDTNVILISPEKLFQNWIFLTILLLKSPDPEDEKYISDSKNQDLNTERNI